MKGNVASIRTTLRNQVYCCLYSVLEAACSRYGPVHTLELLDSVSAPDVALIAFVNKEDAMEFLNHMNGTITYSTQSCHSLLIGMPVKVDGCSTVVVRVSPFCRETEAKLRVLTAAAALLERSSSSFPQRNLELALGQSTLRNSGLFDSADGGYSRPECCDWPSAGEDDGQWSAPKQWGCRFVIGAERM